MRTDILEKEKEIKEWISINQSKSFMCKQLNCKPETLNYWLNVMGLNYDGNQGGKGIKTDPKKRTAEEYSELPSCRSGVLKKKLLNENLIVDVCKICGTTPIWMGKPITLELDHINGDRFDNRLENLRVLCPNCHSQTSTFRRRK